MVLKNTPRMLNPSIMKRIKALGGSVSQQVRTKEGTSSSLEQDLLSISFDDTVLYPRPCDTPWSSAKDTEPIPGIGAYIDEMLKSGQRQDDEFYNKLLHAAEVHLQVAT